jgi:hypothetical protein
MSRITLHLDRGLGWTLPAFVACCCGVELARDTRREVAERRARRRRCPSCGTRGARRLAGTTSLAADLAQAAGWPQGLACRRVPAPPLARRASGRR